MSKPESDLLILPAEISGFIVSLTHRGWFRAVLKTDETTYLSATTFQEIMEKMEDRNRRAEKLGIRKLSLAVLVNGDHATVTGIHATLGTLTGFKRTGSFAKYEIYPDVPGVHHLLALRLKHLKEAEGYNKQLAELAIKDQQNRSGTDASLEALEAEYNDRKAKAEALG